ncbi:MAG TPA: inositol monophosphatase family protein [Gammaproteobacteria bacterium]|nr:inositol monophosphatase family protein [Gammaproteobacteria bacterium]
MKIPFEPLKTQLRDIARRELSSRLGGCAHHFKADGSLLSELDLALNRNIRLMLRGIAPEVAFLSEEMPREKQQRTLHSGAPYWCLDPLDGTSNFVGGIPFFCVSLALVDGGFPSHAIVYDPVRDELFSAIQGQGAWLNETPLQTCASEMPLRKSIGLIDFKRLEKPLAMALIDGRPFSSQRNFGACALEWCWLAAGRGHLLLHGGQKLWDHAAGFLILTEAGGAAETLDGETVFNGTLDTRSVIAAGDPALFAQWRDWIRRFTSPGPS